MESDPKPSFDAEMFGGDSMGEKIEMDKARLNALIGIVFVCQSMFVWSSPEGPWNDPSFTRGVIALVGCGFLYSAGFQMLFRKKGWIPYLRLWKTEPTSIAKITGVAGVVTIVAAVGMGNDSTLPATFSLISLLFGFLLLLYAAYAWLVISGPLREETVAE
uniref:Uncharacterized protein n=2 Tax=environmental samples TaxID=68359 RepID=A0A075G9V8_9EURY|nr:hypothetical protein [uncultured marine group II/III euryarchaeote KM3_07_G11]